MGNSTKVYAPSTMHEQLVRLVESYRGLLHADERRLHEAMLDYERSCWAESIRRAA